MSGARSAHETSLLKQNVSLVPSKLFVHSVWHGLASASNAYTVSCCVTAMTTLCFTLLIVTFATHSGCAYTAASTVQEKSFPNVAVFTFAVVNAYSCAFTPSRLLSLW